MGKWLVAILVGVLAVTGVGALGARLLAAAPSAPGSPEWRLVHEASSLKFSDALVPLGEGDVWAFGTRRFLEWDLGTTAYHWDGERWRDDDLPAGTGDRVMTAGASSSTDVWVVTSGDGTGLAVARWDGNAWSAQPKLPASSAADLVALGGDDVWVFGLETWHHSAAGWTKADLPMEVSHAAARSATDIWAIGYARDGMEPMVGHYDGTSWRIVPLGDALPGSGSRYYALTGVAADASGVLITVNVSDDTSRTTKPLLLRRSAGRWRTEQVEKVAGAWRETSDPIPDGRGGHWFLGSTDVNGDDAALAHRTAAGAWTLDPVSARPGTAEFTTLMAIPGTSQLLATGAIDSTPGVFLHRVR